LLADRGFEVVGQAGDAEELVRKVVALRPDVAVTDIRMPPTGTDDGLRAAEQIGDRQPEVGLLVLSQHLESRYAMRLLERRTHGVGYLLKDRVSDIGMFEEAIRRVAAGGSVVDPRVVATLVERQHRVDPLDELTTRERDILGLMAEGRSNGAIERQLFLSPKTVESHIRNVFMKLDLPPADDDHRRVLAVLAFLRSRGNAAEVPRAGQSGETPAE
jgi:DNA-binding NarL/FixJ family response regulator